MPEFNAKRSQTLPQYSYCMLVQGERGAALDSADEALRLDPDNTEACILYSVLAGKPLKEEILGKLDLDRGVKTTVTQKNGVYIKFVTKCDPIRFECPKDGRIRTASPRMIAWGDCSPCNLDIVVRGTVVIDGVLMLPPLPWKSKGELDAAIWREECRSSGSPEELNDAVDGLIRRLDERLTALEKMR